MFPSESFQKGRKKSSSGSKERLLTTMKVGKVRLHSMAKMRCSDLKTIGEALEKTNPDNR